MGEIASNKGIRRIREARKIREMEENRKGTTSHCFYLSGLFFWHTRAAMKTRKTMPELHREKEPSAINITRTINKTTHTGSCAPDSVVASLSHLIKPPTRVSETIKRHLPLHAFPCLASAQVFLSSPHPPASARLRCPRDMTAPSAPNAAVTLANLLFSMRPTA